MSCHFPLFPMYLHKPFQSRVAALAQEHTLHCRLVDCYNQEPKLCVGLSSTPKLTSIFLQAILLHFGVPQSVIHGDSIGATGDALTYPEALKYKAKELQTTEIKKLMESTTNNDKLKWTSFPPNSEDTRKGRGICRIKKFDCDDDIVYIPKQFRLYDWAMSFLLADDDAPIDPSRVWTVPTTRSTDESKRPSSRPLPLAKNGE